MTTNKKQYLLTIVRYLIFAAAYGYLVWQLVNYKHYDTLAATLTSMHIRQHACFILCIIMMPLNICIEARRWQILMNGTEQLTFKESVEQVLGGMAGAFVTPFRAGEIPARLAFLRDSSHWKEALATGLLGGVIMTAVVIVTGIVPVFLWLAPEHYSRVATYITASLVIIVALLYLFRLVMSKSRGMNVPVGKVTVATIVRYLCFSIQMLLVLYAFGIVLKPTEALVSIPAYYLLVTISPNMPAADLGIRGGWAVFVFPAYGASAPAVALSAAFLWGLNNLLPLLATILLRRKQQ